MPMSGSLPFDGSYAFNKESSTYVAFATQSDAMLASLQLFHDIPRSIIDLVLSLVTHPEFDSRKITLKSSVDVIRSVEEARLEKRMAVVHGRSMGRNGGGRGIDQAGIPLFVLEDILDIVVSSRERRIKELLQKHLEKRDMFAERINQVDLEENVTLSDMSLVHRSWTIPAQRALGKAVFFRTAVLQSHLDYRPFFRRQNSVYGPWTSTLAIQLLHPTKGMLAIGLEDTVTVQIDWSFESELLAAEAFAKEDEIAEHEVNKQQINDLIGFLLTFTNLKNVHIESYFPFYTTLFTPTIKEIVHQNTFLQELSLHAYVYKEYDIGSHFTTASPKDSFVLDFLFEKARLTGNLRSLSTRGAIFSDDAMQNSCLWKVAFLKLRNLEIEYSTVEDKTLITFLSIFSTHPHSHVDSLHIYNKTLDFRSGAATQTDPEQFALALKNVRLLTIAVSNAAFSCKLIPLCHNLQHLTFDLQGFPDTELITENCALVLKCILTLNLRIPRGYGRISWAPFCCNLRDISLKVYMPCSPDLLHDLPSTVRRMRLIFWMLDKTEVLLIDGWEEVLLQKG